MLGIRYKNVTFWLYQRYGRWVVWDGAISGIAFLYWDPTSTSTHRKPKLLPKTAKTRPKCSRLPAGQCSDEMEDIPMIMLYLLSHILSSPHSHRPKKNIRAMQVHSQFWEVLGFGYPFCLRFWVTHMLSKCSLPASSFHAVFGDLYILPPSQPSLLISLKQWCFRWWIAQFQWRACFPQWAVRCKSFSESNIIMWWEARWKVILGKTECE